jgi:hypothetical protein
MKKEPVFTAITMVVITMFLINCNGVGRGMEGNIYEKMTIFSLIALIVIAAFLVSFASNSIESKTLTRYRELIRNAAFQPLSAEELTGNSVYVWDSRKSFQKLLFAKDGSLLESGIVTTNGLDPKAKLSGTWAISSDGSLQLWRNETASTKSYVRVSQNGYNLATLMRPKSGFADAWYLGENNLAKVQISCFGRSDSQPSTEKFTATMVSGVTIYWATYPCLLLTSSNEVSVNPELAYGVITFHADGTLSKSINNPIEAAPDYSPFFAGTWNIDENFGVLNMSVGLYTSEITMLIHSKEHQSLLVGTTAGNEQWFLDPEYAKENLISYLAIGVHLDAGKRALFG